MRSVASHRPADNQSGLTCRRKMRMSGLCKVEMSAFLEAGRPHGRGGDRIERQRAGAVEDAARGRARAPETGRCRTAAAADGSPLRRLQDHPWRKPWKRTFLSCEKPDISTLR